MHLSMSWLPLQLTFELRSDVGQLFIDSFPLCLLALACSNDIVMTSYFSDCNNSQFLMSVMKTESPRIVSPNFAMATTFTYKTTNDMLLTHTSINNQCMYMPAITTGEELHVNLIHHHHQGHSSGGEPHIREILGGNMKTHLAVYEEGLFDLRGGEPF